MNINVIGINTGRGWWREERRAEGRAEGRADLHEEESDDEGRSLTVANFPVVERVGLHDVEETLLAQAVLLLEEVVLRVSPGYITPDHLPTATHKTFNDTHFISSIIPFPLHFPFISPPFPSVIGIMR